MLAKGASLGEGEKPQSFSKLSDLLEIHYLRPVLMKQKASPLVFIFAIVAINFS